MRHLQRNQRLLASIYAADNHTFLTWAYHTLLGRAPDEQGRATYINALDRGAERFDVLWQLITSREYLALAAPSKSVPDEIYLRSAYRSCLLREPDENGLRYYLAALKSGKLSRSGVLDSLKNSEEALTSSAVQCRNALVDLLRTYGTLKRNPFSKLLGRADNFTKDAFVIGTLATLGDALHSIQRALPILTRCHDALQGEALDPSEVPPQAAKSVQLAPFEPTHPTTLTIDAPNRAIGGKRDVFIFAVIDWHFRIQRPQHIARALSESGHRVFYISNEFLDSDEPGYDLEQLSSAHFLYQVRLRVKGRPAIYFAPPTNEALAMLQASIAHFIEDFQATSSISIIQHAYWYPLITRLPNSIRLYDCMDNHEGFGNVPAQLIEIEKDMLAHADLVSVTSIWLDEYAKRFNSNVALIRNAAEYEHFCEQPVLAYTDPLGRRIIGYYGAIAEWFDIDIIRSLAESYPDCLILLVGNDTVDAQGSLADFPNVEFTGEVAYSRLPFYLYAFDVCLLPFKVIPLTLATNPVKVYEYLAAGKPVVCVDLPEIGQFGHLVSRASSTEEFVSAVGQSLLEIDHFSNKMCRQRRRFASEETWHRRALQLTDAVASLQMPKVSVIILTYNNWALTQACLHSVMSCSDYENLELIVVDNASTDQTREALRNFELQHKNVRVVLNDSNLGFAAGNNVGLSMATGEYLVLLNNDTIVTHGWILTMLRHFQSEPKLGLLGPVTNNIGNEARIVTHYESIDNMPAEAVRYTLTHMGERYPLRTAAFFCVMLSLETFERCGPISEDFRRGFFEDDDYCRRVEKLGLIIECAEDVFVHHHLSASFSKLSQEERQQLFDENRQKYEAKWGKWIPHTYRSTAA